MSYSDNKQWRLAHTERRNTSRQRYYAKTQDAPNRYSRWTPQELAVIMDPDRPADSVTSAKLGRSVQAIQARRSQYLEELGARQGEHHVAGPAAPPRESPTCQDCWLQHPEGACDRG